MKKEQFNPANKLSLDKETVSKLTIEQLSEIAGGAEEAKSRKDAASVDETEGSCCFLSCISTYRCGGDAIA